MNKILEIKDLKYLAKRNVPKMFYDYVDSGSWTESTYGSNEEDFKKIKLRQRVGNAIKDRNLETTILDKKFALPFGFSPAGMGGMLYPDGEVLVAKVSAEKNIPYILSTMTICSLETITSSTNGTFWFQLYVMKDKKFVKDIIERAKNAKCEALVITMDLPVLGQRHNDLRNGLSSPPKMKLKHILQLIKKPLWCFNMLKAKNKTFGNIMGHAEGVEDLSSIVSWTNNQFDQNLSWDYIDWIKKMWKGPIIIKGILDEEDAELAKNKEVEGIIVSNHGGRQLDGTISSISALKNIVDRVGNDLNVFFDGGVRSGQDVIKALAIGAKGVFIGRPYLYGLGAAGKKGVEIAVDILKKEIDLTLALCGEKNISNLNRGNLYNYED